LEKNIIIDFFYRYTPWPASEKTNQVVIALYNRPEKSDVTATSGIRVVGQTNQRALH